MKSLEPERSESRPPGKPKMGFPVAIIGLGLLAPIAIAPVEMRKHHKVTVKVLDREAPVKVCGPAALDLHPTGAVFLRGRGNQVIAGEVGIRLERLDALDQEMSQYQELSTRGF